MIEFIIVTILVLVGLFTFNTCVKVISYLLCKLLKK